jgi:hypothetical protein
MRKPHLCALLSCVSIAALQTWPAAAGQRQLSQERWMLHQDGARTSRGAEVRVHFFNPNQVVRVTQKSDATPVVRPAVIISRPAPVAPAVPAKWLVVAATRSAPPPAANHPADRARPQPEVRSGR